MSFFSFLRSAEAKIGLKRGNKGARFGSIFKKFLMPHTLLPHHAITNAVRKKSLSHAPSWMQKIGGILG